MREGAGKGTVGLIISVAVPLLIICRWKYVVTYIMAVSNFKTWRKKHTDWEANSVILEAVSAIC